MTTISQSSKAVEVVQLRTHPLGCACLQCRPIELSPKVAKPDDAATRTAAGDATRGEDAKNGKDGSNTRTAARVGAAAASVYSLKEDGSVHAPVDATDTRGTPPAGTHLDVRA